MSFLTIIDILGTFSFSVAGAFAAMEKRLDPFGVLVISFATAIGGGTIRDILIGELPVSWLTNEIAVWTILTGAVMALFFGSYLKKFDRMLFLFDAAGLGLFTLIGIQKGQVHGLSTGICVMLGTVTGCFGGVLRDVLLNSVPLLFHKKEIYGVASITGGFCYFLLIKFGLDDKLAALIGILIVFFTRLLAVRLNLALPIFYSKPTSK